MIFISWYEFAFAYIFIYFVVSAQGTRLPCLHELSRSKTKLQLQMKMNSVEYDDDGKHLSVVIM